jgi:conserved oligomeric Golgi complex subunit 2
LAAPHSPIVPHTPFGNGFKTSLSPVPPRTPWTPFTAFASKQNPFDFTFGAAANIQGGSGSIGIPWLDDADDPLAGLFNRILKFVDRDLRAIMEAAERVCVRSGSRQRSAITQQVLPAIAVEKSSRKGDGGSFEIMANVVWAEISRAIMDELGNVVFAAGKPDEFRKV